MELEREIELYILEKIHISNTISHSFCKFVLQHSFQVLMYKAHLRYSSCDRILDIPLYILIDETGLCLGGKYFLAQILYPLEENTVLVFLVCNQHPYHDNLSLCTLLKLLCISIHVNSSTSLWLINVIYPHNNIPVLLLPFTLIISLSIVSLLEKRISLCDCLAKSRNMSMFSLLFYLQEVIRQQLRYMSTSNLMPI